MSGKLLRSRALVAAILVTPSVVGPIILAPAAQAATGAVLVVYANSVGFPLEIDLDETTASGDCYHVRNPLPTGTATITVTNLEDQPVILDSDTGCSTPFTGAPIGRPAPADGKAPADSSYTYDGGKAPQSVSIPSGL